MIGRKELGRAAVVMVATCIFLATNVAAHLTNPAGSLTSGAFTGNNCRREGALPVCDTHAGVSGTYVTTNRVEAFDMGTPYLKSCDREWVVADDHAANEPVVDGDATLSPSGRVRDGTWDDGGLGGACHTDNGPWPWTTDGCAGTVYAQDAIQSGDVWISAQCDYTTPVGGAVSASHCWVNQVVLGQDLEADTVFFCAEATLSLFDPPTWNTSCGSDGIHDDARFGEGGGLTGPGVQMPAVGSDKAEFPVTCDAIDGLALVEVLTKVDGGLAFPATAGWIDNREN